jgi:hypothetical protein
VIKLSDMLGFQWDAGNESKSTDKHGVSRNEAEQVFFNEPILLATDDRHSDNEARYYALGHTDDDRLLHVTFTLRGRGRLIRVISARDMHRKERQRYDQEA